MSPIARLLRSVLMIFALIGVIALLMFFPRFLAVAEVALRELRYVWWLVVLAAVALYLVFGTGRRRR
ncbi:hypothetical protein [Nibricoccus sp. IMCC34717]|uniref:hypothetical protein n=1 Tax=Nibricoccus sp. IMCC34717 TaxID=3034021 RepID=UPI00384DA564